MRLLSLSVLFALMLPGLGCSNETPAEQTASSSSSESAMGTGAATPSGSPLAPASMSPATMAPNPAQLPDPGTPPMGNGPDSFAAAAAALEAAINAGSMAPGNTPCEQAYNGARAMIEALESQAGMGSARLPNQDEFLALCGSMPEEAQRCMVIEYSMAHREDCRRVMETEEAQRVRNALRQRARAGAPAQP